MEKVTKGKIGSVEFQFNPTELSQSFSSSYATPKILGRQTELLHYTGGSGASTDLHIFLDNNYARDPEYTAIAISDLGEYVMKGENDAPPVVLFEFGISIYWVVVTKIEVVNKLCDAQNIVTQAEVILSIKEYVDEEYHRTRREQKGRRFLFISQGDTASFRSLAEQVYNNADLWQAISDFNPNVLLRMLGPIIPAGTRIEIPSWAIAKAYLNTPQTGLVKYE